MKRKISPNYLCGPTEILAPVEKQVQSQVEIPQVDQELKPVKSVTYLLARTLCIAAMMLEPAPKH